MSQTEYEHLEFGNNLKIQNKPQVMFQKSPQIENTRNHSELEQIERQLGPFFIVVMA